MPSESEKVHNFACPLTHVFAAKEVDKPQMRAGKRHDRACPSQSRKDCALTTGQASISDKAPFSIASQNRLKAGLLESHRIIETAA